MFKNLRLQEKELLMLFGAQMAVEEFDRSQLMGAGMQCLVHTPQTALTNLAENAIVAKGFADIIEIVSRERRARRARRPGGMKLAGEIGLELLLIRVILKRI